MKHSEVPDDDRSTPMASEYWEGFYMFGDSVAVRLSDGPAGGTATGLSLRDGGILFTFDFPIDEDTVIGSVFDRISSECGERFRVRLSSEVDTPDRHAEIEAAIGRGDPFSTASVKELAKRLMSAGIITMGGPMGYRDLYDGGYAGFYLMSDGSVLRCRDLTQWDLSMGIVDGVQECTILDPDDLSSPPRIDIGVGYIRGDTFAHLADLLAEHGARPVAEIGLEGSDAFSMMNRAVGGDRTACDVCRHRIRQMAAGH